jgi:hypothetical protein
VIAVFYPPVGCETSGGAYRPQPEASPWRALTPSPSAARCHALGRGAASGAGAVSAMNCSIAAAIAAVSCGEADGETTSILGRGGRRCPLLATGAI